MFLFWSISSINTLNYTQNFLFCVLVNLIKIFHVPRFDNLALLNYAENFSYILYLASLTDLPKKFIDFSLDASEFYFNELNINSEINYFLWILLKTNKNYQTICLISLFFIFWRDRKKVFLFWVYSISLPFIFFFIILYIDYIEGYLD